MFDDKFLEGLPSNPKKALRKMCSQYIYYYNSTVNNLNDDTYENYLTDYAAIEAFLGVCGIHIDSVILTDKRESNIKLLLEYVQQVYRETGQVFQDDTLEQARDKFRSRFGVGFFYEFSEGDLGRIQTLVNELRDLIQHSEVFDANHKERLLKKLESMQKELHKKMPSLEKLWGFIGDAGVALGKFGSDAKPFVDRIREILQITWRTQARSEELPSATPLPLLSDKATDDCPKINKANP